MNNAYAAYVRAGKPEELREAFADVFFEFQRFAFVNKMSSQPMIV